MRVDLDRIETLAAGQNLERLHGTAPSFHLLTGRDALEQYVAVNHIYDRILDRELKKGSAELVILALVEHRPRHGYEISQVIEDRSDGAVRFKVASLYPLLYRLEKRGWIKGRWVEKAGERSRCFYRLTPEGRRVLAQQRETWQAYVLAVNQVMNNADA